MTLRKLFIILANNLFGNDSKLVVLLYNMNKYLSINLTFSYKYLGCIYVRKAHMRKLMWFGWINKKLASKFNNNRLEVIKQWDKYNVVWYIFNKFTDSVCESEFYL